MPELSVQRTGIECRYDISVRNVSRNRVEEFEGSTGSMSAGSVKRRVSS
jgi:hypothetical protein